MDADLTKRKPTDRGVIFAKIVGCLALGNTAGPLLSGLLLNGAGFFLPLVVHAIMAGLTLVLIGESWGRDGGIVECWFVP